MSGDQQAEQIPPEVVGLLPQQLADARTVIYTTPSMKQWINDLVNALGKQHPRAPKNVIWQIALFVLGRHWAEVSDLVARWDAGEPLNLSYAQPAAQGGTPQDGEKAASPAADSPPS